MPTKVVKVPALNFRKQPGGEIISSLRIGKKVDVLKDANVPGWKQVQVSIEGTATPGFVHGAFLRDPVSDAKEALMNAAIKQWTRFNRGAGKEHQHPFFKFVGEMWKSIGMDLDGKDTGVPWSAAFISFVVRKASKKHQGYKNFKFAAAHARFIHQAIQRQMMNEDGPYWGFQRLAHKPQLGDLVVQWRKTPRTFEFARDHNAFASHTDLVVEVGEDFVHAIGGNVGNSVKMKAYNLNSNGFLRNEKKVIAVLRNNL